MSGHSKWATIKRKKGAADAKRGQLFSKLSRQIMVAARMGGGDPEANYSLANAIEKAKANSMPADNIKRAIDKGAGAGADGGAYETVVYEGYGPAGVAVIAECLTDNRNRTAADVRHAFTKAGGSLGTTNSVAFQFDRRGVLIVTGAPDEDALLEAALEGGDVVDLAMEDESTARVVTAKEDLAAVRDALTTAGFTVESAELTMVPQVTVPLDADDARKVLRLIDVLEEHDDVQDVYANFDVSDEVMEAVAG